MTNDITGAGMKVAVGALVVALAGTVLWGLHQRKADEDRLRVQQGATVEKCRNGDRGNLPSYERQSARELCDKLAAEYAAKWSESP